MPQLIDAKLERGKDMEQRFVYLATFVFGSPLTNKQGKHVGKAHPIHMQFMNGMEPADFVVGLRDLADHIEKNFNLSPTSAHLQLVEDKDGD